VRHPRGHENDGPRSYVADVVADRDPTGPGDDVIHLVLGMGLLEIRLADRQDIQADAQVRDRNELEIGSPGVLPTSG
jgi:hypothetical protein